MKFYHNPGIFPLLLVKFPLLLVYIYIYIIICIWVNYNDLTATSLEIMVRKGNHPHMALIQVSEILEFTQIHVQHRPLTERWQTDNAVGWI